jgi:rSAM/selenodomain-associated transferase 2
MFQTSSKSMAISVIIPALNEQTTIASVLKNIVSLDGIEEVIVVDGGSTDNTPLIAAGYARVVHSPQGRARQMNAGAAAAKGDVLLFLHADTLLPVEAATVIKQCLANPKVIGGRFRVRLDNTGWRFRMVGWSINMRDRLIKGFTGDQAIFVRHEIFEKLGGYPDIPLMEDLELGRRMCRAGKVVQLKECVTTSARRWKNNGVIRTVLLMWALRLLFFAGCPASFLLPLYKDAR